MKLLLDSHVFLWWMEEADMKDEAEEAIANPDNLIFVSALSLWEIVIKRSLGKLKTKADLLEEVEKNRFVHLPVTARHALEVEKLPFIHHNPFDRMLIAQAGCEKLTLVTRDKDIRKYDVPWVLA